MSRSLHLVVLAALLTACGPGSFSDLGRPALVVVVTEGGGFCSSVFAIDASNAVWASTSCGGSASALEVRDMSVDAAVRAELDAQMDEVLLLGNDPECDIVSPSGRRFRFLRAVPSVADPPEVRQCEPGVPLVAVRLAQALEALAAPATLDAGVDAGL